jgi:hypothetical protein
METQIERCITLSLFPKLKHIPKALGEDSEFAYCNVISEGHYDMTDK